MRSDQENLIVITHLAYPAHLKTHLLYHLIFHNNLLMCCVFIYSDVYYPVPTARL